MEITEDKVRTAKFFDKRFIIYLPDYNNEAAWRYFVLPSDVFDHKEYPRCKCGIKFVPKNGMTKCWFCRRK